MRPYIVFNCRADELTRERLGFHSALARVADVIVAPVKRIVAEGIELADGRHIPVLDVAALWHLDPPQTPIPEGLPSTQFPTLWIHMDAGSGIANRSLWSRLFDVVCLCAWDGTGYRHDGSYRIVLQPYAARTEWFTLSGDNDEFDIGWVGEVRGKIYSRRERLLPQLATRYSLNPNWTDHIDENEVLPIYRRSRIVVNIQRDDYQGWYNIRCFEAFASGALVAVEHPTHLEDAGFREDVHYIGYASESELLSKIDYYLQNNSERRKIATTAREFVRCNHTYDHRLKELLPTLTMENAERRREPSRATVGFIYCHYYSKRNMLSEAKASFFTLLKRSPILAVTAIPVLLRCFYLKCKQRFL